MIEAGTKMPSGHLGVLDCLILNEKHDFLIIGEGKKKEQAENQVFHL